jgi:hypothetical protein
MESNKQKSVLKKIVLEMLREQQMFSTGIISGKEEKDLPIETQLIDALQKDKNLTGRLKNLTNFNQADSLIKALLSLTKIPPAQIKTGLSKLSTKPIPSMAKS